MKQCPKCHETYNDSWGLCLQDGSALIAVVKKTRKGSASSKSQPKKEKNYKDVYGWLALYVWTQLILGPLAFVLVVYSCLNNGQSSYVYPMGLPIAAQIVNAVISFAEVVGAILLLRPKEFSAWFVRVSTACVVIFRIYCVYFVADKGISEIASGVLTLGFESIWFFYFIFSKRVKSRYFSTKKTVSQEHSLDEIAKTAFRTYNRRR